VADVLGEFSDLWASHPENEAVEGVVDVSGGGIEKPRSLRIQRWQSGRHIGRVLRLVGFSSIEDLNKESLWWKW